MRSTTGKPVIGGWYVAAGVHRTPPPVVALSIVAHLLLLAAFIDSSGPTPAAELEPSFRPVFYLPPPNRPVTEAGSGERIRYVTAGAGEDATGPSDAAQQDGDPRRLAVPRGGSPGDQVAPQEAGAPGDEEPVYTVVEVHEEAARVANSAAPAYPPQLLAEGIEGTVLVRYIVEADGSADVSSLHIISTTRREFADAVREALPHMRFSPARIDDRPVRQLVEQPFSFRIQRPPPSDTSGSTASRN